MANYIIVAGIRIATEFVPETFGRLTTIGPVFKIGVRRYQVCQCSCGTIGVYDYGNIASQHTRSCGCLRTEDLLLRSKTHGESSQVGGKRRTREFVAWTSMRRRCYAKTSKDYPDYGGRGITVCDRWMEPNGQGYLNFLADMGRKPNPKYSLERKEVNGNYCPENCIWATPLQQSRNRRNIKQYAAFGKTQGLSVWAEEYGFDLKAVWNRLKNGMDLESALTTPIRKKRNEKNT